MRGPGRGPAGVGRGAADPGAAEPAVAVIDLDLPGAPATNGDSGLAAPLKRLFGLRK